jgi:hypothetical protein
MERRIRIMDTIDLAYVGRGIHEELIAHVADQEGYFADEGIHVAIHDGTGWDDDRLRSCATIGLGRAVLSRLTDGVEWTVQASTPIGHSSGFSAAATWRPWRTFEGADSRYSSPPVEYPGHSAALQDSDSSNSPSEAMRSLLAE